MKQLDKSIASFIYVHCMKYPAEYHNPTTMIILSQSDNITTCMLTESCIVQYDKDNIYSVLFDIDKSINHFSDYRTIKKFLNSGLNIKAFIPNKFINMVDK